MIVKREPLEIDGNTYDMLRIYETEEEEYPAQMGKKKAQLFMEKIAEIEAWVVTNQEKSGGYFTEIENGKYPWKLRLGSAKRFIEHVADVAAFAAEE